jgi:hypothetical protein
MDTENIFRKSEWIGQQKAWAAAPPRLRKMAAEFFLIPQKLEDDLLPSVHLPIAHMLEFCLPLQNPTTTVIQLFSNNTPDISDQALILRVRRLPIPDSKTINKLVASSRQASLDGTQSVSIVILAVA